jgi:hypothetical protein
MKWIPVIAILAFYGCNTNESKSPLKVNTTSSEIISNQENPILGDYELLSWSAERKDGSKFYPYGPEAVGSINYLENGRMSLHLMQTGRIPLESNVVSMPTVDDAVEVFQNYMGYSGDYSIDSSGSAVIHHIDISSYPNWIGLHQKRFFSFSGDTLKLQTGNINGNVHTLFWRAKN